MSVIKKRSFGNRVSIGGRTWEWNTSYKVYNALDNYEQLTTEFVQNANALVIDRSIGKPSFHLCTYGSMRDTGHSREEVVEAAAAVTGMYAEDINWFIKGRVTGGFPTVARLTKGNFIVSVDVVMNSITVLVDEFHYA